MIDDMLFAAQVLIQLDEEKSFIWVGTEHGKFLYHVMDVFNVSVDRHDRVREEYQPNTARTTSAANQRPERKSKNQM